MPKSLGQALYDAGFRQASYYPPTGGSGEHLPAPVTHDFHPEAEAPIHRYGTSPKLVKGFPDGIPHGGKFSTRIDVGGVAQDPELAALVANPAFLAANPSFRGVELDYDRDYLDLCFVAGAWRFLVAEAAKVDPNPPGATGPVRGPNGGDPAPGVISPAPVGPTPATPAAADPSARRAAALAKFTEGLELLYPGEVEPYEPLANLLAIGRRPTLSEILVAIAPLLE